MVNCAAMKTQLLEWSELVGTSGAPFTGAHQRKPGRLRAAPTAAIS